MWFHLLLTSAATMEPFLLAVGAAVGGEVGPFIRGLSEDLEEAPVVEDGAVVAAAELVAGRTPPDCFTE